MNIAERNDHARRSNGKPARPRLALREGTSHKDWDPTLRGSSHLTQPGQLTLDASGAGVRVMHPDKGTGTVTDQCAGCVEVTWDNPYRQKTWHVYREQHTLCVFPCSRGPSGAFMSRIA